MEDTHKQSDDRYDEEPFKRLEDEFRREQQRINYDIRKANSE